MDRLVDLLIFLVRETRINRLNAWSKYHPYSILAILLIAVVNMVAYVLAAFFGNWISIIVTGVTLLALLAALGIPLMTNLKRPRRVPPTSSSPHEQAYRHYLSHHHPLEKRTTTCRRFRVIDKTNLAARKRHSLYQIKRSA